MSIMVFASYSSHSSKDEMLWKKLEVNLTPRRDGPTSKIQLWNPHKNMVAGQNRKQEIDKHLQQARIFLLLLSADYLVDPECREQMDQALTRMKQESSQVYVLPILLRPTNLRGANVEKLQLLPRNQNPISRWSDLDDAILEVTSEIYELIDHIATVPTPVSPSSPTPSLAPSSPPPELLKVKALFLAANAKSTPRLAIDEEMRAIEQKVRASEHRDALVFQSAWAVRPDDLLQLLNQHQPQIVHFSGHGSSQGYDSVQGLSFVSDDGKSRRVTTQALDALFRTLQGNIRLIVLNACYSSDQARVLVETIDCVIGMKETIHDLAAITFVSSFYRAIGFGHSIQKAFEQGRVSLLLEGIPEEDIPELLVKQGVDADKIVLIAPSAPPRP